MFEVISCGNIRKYQPRSIGRTLQSVCALIVIGVHFHRCCMRSRSSGSFGWWQTFSTKKWMCGLMNAARSWSVTHASNTFARVSLNPRGLSWQRDHGWHGGDAIWISKCMSWMLHVKTFPIETYMSGGISLEAIWMHDSSISIAYHLEIVYPKFVKVQ